VNPVRLWMLTERSKRQRNKHTIALATPNRISVKLLHLIMPLQVIPWSPPCLFCVSGIHRERCHGATRSTRPITVYERTAICKSQLEPIIENPGNIAGAEQAFGRRFADGLYRGLVTRPFTPELTNPLSSLKAIAQPNPAESEVFGTWRRLSGND